MKQKLLNTPLQIGKLTLRNRVVMAPLTRSRCDHNGVPSSLMIKYYSQRASAGLIIAEATAVMPGATGYLNTPGIWNNEQMLAWRNITDAVHENGGIIAIQLWHVGRISDPIFQDGKKPVAPSPVPALGYVSLLRPKRKFVVPKELTIPEIEDIKKAFAQAAKNAISAGFDAITLHGANGYLINQFLNIQTNLRTDNYGGSLENRCRFALEVVDSVIEAIGADKVGFHISPNDDEHDLLQQDFETRLSEYKYLVKELEKRKVAFIFSRESQHLTNRVTDFIRDSYTGALIVNEDYNAETAQESLIQNKADAVGFGQLFISNPDLPFRLIEGTELTEPIKDWFYYTPPENGYTDYEIIKKD